MNLIDLKILLHVLDRETLSGLTPVDEYGNPLTPAETLILSTVARHEPLSVGELATATGFVQSYVSSIVARLEARGMVTLAGDPADRRRTLVSFHANLRSRVSSALGVDARPMLERLLGDGGTYSVDEVIAVLEYLFLRTNSRSTLPTSMAAPTS